MLEILKNTEKEYRTSKIFPIISILPSKITTVSTFGIFPSSVFLCISTHSLTHTLCIFTKLRLYGIKSFHIFFHLRLLPWALFSCHQIIFKTLFLIGCNKFFHVVILILYHTSNSMYWKRTHQVYVSVKLSPSLNGSPSQLVSRLETSESSLLLPFSLIPYKWHTSKCCWYSLLNSSQPFGRNRIGSSLPPLFWSRSLQAHPWNTTMIHPNITASWHVLIPEPRMAPNLLYLIWTIQSEIQGNLPTAPGSHLSKFPLHMSTSLFYLFKTSQPSESTLLLFSLLFFFYLAPALIMSWSV